MKGFLALCVVLGHIANGCLEVGMYPEARGFLYNIYNLMYAFHMPMFMMVSGYVFYTAYFDDKGQPEEFRIKRQVLNLIAIYVIFSIPFGFLKFVLGHFVNRKVSIADIGLIAVRPIGLYWYLYALILLYILFTVVPLLKLKTFPVLLVLGVISLFSNVVSIPWVEVNRTLYHALFFYIGISYSRHSKQLTGNAPLTAGLFAAAVLLCVFFWNHEMAISAAINRIFLVRNIVALGFALALWYMFEHVRFLGNNRFLKMCGRYSLEIYMIHSYFSTGLRTIFPRIGVTNAYVSVAVNLVISTAVPILFALCCKKTGIHGLLFKPISYLSGLRKFEKAKTAA